MTPNKIDDFMKFSVAYTEMKSKNSYKYDNQNRTWVFCTWINYFTFNTYLKIFNTTHPDSWCLNFGNAHNLLTWFTISETYLGIISISGWLFRMWIAVTVLGRRFRPIRTFSSSSEHHTVDLDFHNSLYQIKMTVAAINRGTGRRSHSKHTITTNIISSYRNTIFKW